MLIRILNHINNFNNLIFAPFDNLIEKLPIADWAVDAICDSLHLIPFLFFVFFVVEIIEFYYADKINAFLKKSKKNGVLVGSLAAIFPQCGFSVIASGLYVKRIITLGTLIAVYLATSDETIPVLLAIPSKSYLIIPIIGIKLFIGIIMGYFIDLVIRTTPLSDSKNRQEIIEEGCCKHDIGHSNKREIFLHPILHTLNTVAFILCITLILNYCLSNIAIVELINGGKFIQPIAAAFIGLIPNCAVSIGLTMMLVKGMLSFGAVMSGLLANAGLGLLVLLKNNDFKDTLRIITILVCISIISGIAINILL